MLLNEYYKLIGTYSIFPSVPSSLTLHTLDEVGVIDFCTTTTTKLDNHPACRSWPLECNSQCLAESKSSNRFKTHQPQPSCSSGFPPSNPKLFRQAWSPRIHGHWSRLSTLGDAKVNEILQYKIYCHSEIHWLRLTIDIFRHNLLISQCSQVQSVTC